METTQTTHIQCPLSSRLYLRCLGCFFLQFSNISKFYFVPNRWNAKQTEFQAQACLLFLFERTCLKRFGVFLFNRTAHSHRSRLDAVTQPTTACCQWPVADISWQSRSDRKGCSAVSEGMETACACWQRPALVSNFISFGGIRFSRLKFQHQFRRVRTMSMMSICLFSYVFQTGRGCHGCFDRCCAT